MSLYPQSDSIDADEQFLVNVAWAYYVEGLTQGQVAQKLGVTRLRVNKALAEARQRGVVQIAINSPFGPCAEMQASLKERFGLQEAVVVPSPNDAEQVQTIVGAALGQYLSKLLQDPAIKLFGMSWGNTLNIATRFLTPINRPDLEIVSTMGGLTQGSDLNTFEVTTRLAKHCKARHSYFTAPLYAGSRQSRDAMMKIDVLQEVLTKIRRVDAVAMAAGDMSEASLLVRHGLPKDVKMTELMKAGAVGDALGQFLDERGGFIDHSINDRVLGVGVRDLEQMRQVILAAGGAHKVPILTALLLRGTINVFVSDEATAQAVLAPAKDLGGR